MARGFGASESGPYGEAGYGRLSGGDTFSSSDPQAKPFLSATAFEKNFSGYKSGDDQVFDLANGATTKIITTIDNPYEISFNRALSAYGTKATSINTDALAKESPDLFSLVNTKGFKDSLEEAAKQRAIEDYSDWKTQKNAAEQDEDESFGSKSGPGPKPTQSSYEPLGLVSFTDSSGAKQTWAYSSNDYVRAKTSYGWEQSEDDVDGREFIDDIELDTTPEKIFSSLKFTRLT